MRHKTDGADRIFNAQPMPISTHLVLSVVIRLDPRMPKSQCNILCNNNATSSKNL